MVVPTGQPPRGQEQDRVDLQGQVAVILHKSGVMR